jgi:type IV pilus assembly protein PilY1
MKTQLQSLAARTLAYSLALSIAAQPAFAAPVAISSTPLATSGGSSILANLLFVLDDSGSMNYDYLPDNVNATRQCMTRSSGSDDCNRGDTPYEAGGQNGSNGAAYDPNFHYKPALNPDATNVLGSIDLTAVPNDAFGAQSTSNTNVTNGITEARFCNSNNVCKRNGAVDANPATTLVSGTDGFGTAHPAGRFPYRTNPANASTAVFGLPEMMSMGTFTRSGTTVTVTTLGPHEMVNGDQIYVDHSNNSFDVTCNAPVAVTSTSATSFTYGVSGSGTINASAGTYRKCVASNANGFVRAGNVVTVSSNAHGLVTNDRLTTFVSGGNAMNVSNVSVTVVNADSFTYTTGTSGAIAATTGRWVRVGLYNDRNTTSSAAPAAYTITPVEYCADANLTNCVEVAPGNTPPAGFTNPAYVRFCRTQEQALSPGAISDPTGTPRCRGKYVEAGSADGNTWRWARYGLFNRTTIHSSIASYTRSNNRSDCAGAPSCTYDEEIANYARWFTYYRTRMQMMKTAAGRAFQPFVSDPTASPTAIPDKLRVGFITINPYYPNDGNAWSGTISDPAAKYLKVSNFSTAHATDWYKKFYEQKPAHGTPLREALSRAGWIFAGKLNTGITNNIPNADDPVQAACQRNFALLTTDGYWNGNNGVDIAQNAIDNADNRDPTIDAPYAAVSVDRTTTGTFDGGIGSSEVTATPTTVNQEVICQGNNQTNFTGAPQTNCGCAVTEHRVMRRTHLQTATVTTQDGKQTGSSTSNDYTFTPTTACIEGNWAQSEQPKTVTQILRCIDGGGSDNNPVTFDDGASRSCNFCSSSRRRVLIRQVRPATQTVVTTDGVQTSSTTAFTPATPITYSYSRDGSNWNTTVPSDSSGCTDNNLNGFSGTNSANNGGSTVTGSGAGTPVAVTLTPNPSAPVVGTVSTTTVGGGYPDTLADVAMYYYRTDLRGGKDFKGNATGPATSPSADPSGSDVSDNVVPAKSGAKNFAVHQHMITFSVGMVDGLMRFQPDYENSTTGDFANIKNGTDGACFWSSGICNWPKPERDEASALDDLWHAAVNGRGQYFLAKDVDGLSAGIQSTLNAVNAQVAAAAASATSSPNITQTNNQIFSTTYETITWSGKVFAQTIDPNTGNVNPAIQWHADELLLAKVGPTSDTRALYTFDSAATGKVKPFEWGSLTTDEQDFFIKRCSIGTPLTQCASLTGASLDTAEDGKSLVEYLRGQTGNEGAIFRDRTFIDPATNAVVQTVLGDTISAKPAYVRESTFSYGGSYTPFAVDTLSRAPRVYVGANDGYLHAFDGDTGVEAWAYTPRFLMGGLYQLADTGYSTAHRYYVDGSPETGDVCVDAACAAKTDWRTILVGGVNGGGRGYYALDITNADTADPSDDVKALWEFCADAAICDVADPDLGLSYGNAVIGKRSSDGRWVVVVSSGLNNISPGSGRGFFFVLDAITGAILDKVGIGVGDTTNPAGLMKLSAFYDSALTDATFRYIYAGDQLGNVWRLDMGAPVTPPAVAPAPTVLKMATLLDDDGRAQPITTKLALTHIGNKRILYVGTGRYLGTPDLTDQGAGEPAWQQTLYAFIDKDADYGASLRANANMKARTLTAISPTERGIDDAAVDVDWTLNEGGWYLDFNPSFGTPPTEASPGEGVNVVDPRLVLGTLVVTTNAPASGGGSCAVGGSSFFYNFDFKTGQAVSSSPNGVVGISLGSTITVGVAVVQLPSGAIKAISTGADTTKTTSGVTIGASGAAVKRFSYRLR